jgi:hypothetical protein
MEPENLAVIDVESDSIDSPEPEDEEIWYSALQIQGLLKLSKAGLQQSISKHQSIYGLDIATLRRGAARATHTKSGLVTPVMMASGGQGRSIAIYSLSRKDEV